MFLGFQNVVGTKIAIYSGCAKSGKPNGRNGGIEQATLNHSFHQHWFVYLEEPHL